MIRLVIAKTRLFSRQDCGEPLSVFSEDPTTLPMRLTQTMVRLVDPDSGQGTVSVQDLPAVCAFTQSYHSKIPRSLCAVLEIPPLQERELTTAES
jgi:hypothetical protein